MERKLDLLISSGTLADLISTKETMQHIRNIAIIAHVDHGKTTLVDCLLKQSGTFRANQHESQEERLMDSMDLEREKGITIRAKNAAFKYKNYHINIVDTPGHADFGGEVERIMNMIDGVLLVVDSVDGPQAQTRFVLRKALEAGAKPIVVINKIDRDNATPHKVLDAVFDLFVSLHATDEQLDFPVTYASAKGGYRQEQLDQARGPMEPLFLAGIDGKLVTARHIWERLVKEVRTNVALRIAQTDAPNIFNVSGRGEMQIAILVEQMRREGYEVLVSRPEVIYRRDENGNLLEPIERLFLEIPKAAMGDVLQNLAGRKGEITNMNHHGDDVSIEALVPTRGLIGFETDLVNQTRGLGVMSHLFHEYGADRGGIAARKNGSLVSMESGEAMAYALNMIQERGRLMVEPGEAIYEGMIVGENARENDIPVNPCKAKKLTKMRSQGEGKGIQLNPPLKMSLERALEYIGPDEYVEATPKNLRLRKKLLDENQRKRAAQSRASKVVAA